MNENEPGEAQSTASVPAAKPTLVQRFKAAPVTFVLAAINVAYFVWIERHGSSYDGNVLMRFGAVEASHVRAGEYWRLASYMFVHIGWIHLLMNTWAGSTWNLLVEPVFGHRRFLLVYVLGGIGGGIACACFSSAITAGASGALFGIIGATLTLRGRVLGGRKRFVADRMVRSTVTQIVIWTGLGMTILPMSNAAHLGGLVTGAAATWVLTLRERRRIGWAVFAAVFLAFLAYAVRPLS